MTYYICHRMSHIGEGKDCVKVPYGDQGLYDRDCLTMPLTLVGLIEDKLPGQQPQEWICRSLDHIIAKVVCTTTGHKSILNGLYGRHDHEWVRLYKKGDYVLARGLVTADFLPTMNRASVSVDFTPGNGGRWIPLDAIMGLTQRPVPPEPNRKSLLRSKNKEGQLIGWRGSWRVIGDEFDFETGLEWPDVWENYGPFDEFKPSGEIK